MEYVPTPLSPATLVAHYHRVLDPASDPIPPSRAAASRFLRRYLNLKESAGGYPDEAWPLFLDFARHHPDLTALDDACLLALWREVWDSGSVELPKHLTPMAQLVWLGGELTTLADPKAVIDEAFVLHSRSTRRRMARGGRSPPTRSRAHRGPARRTAAPVRRPHRRADP